MKTLALILSFLTAGLILMSYEGGTKAQSCDVDFGPSRLVIIKGKATIINFPGVGQMPATSETIIFQKVGCSSCYIGTHTDSDGNYKISVGHGKYKIIVRNPSSPEFDMLVPEQERFIDTETLEAKKYSQQVFDFDIKIRLPK